MVLQSQSWIKESLYADTQFVALSAAAWGPTSLPRRSQERIGWISNAIFRTVGVWDVGWSFQQVDGGSTVSYVQQPMTHSLVPLSGTCHDWLKLVRAIVEAVGDDPQVFRGVLLRAIVKSMWSSWGEWLYLKIVTQNVLAMLAFTWLASIEDERILQMTSGDQGSTSMSGSGSASSLNSTLSAGSFDSWTSPPIWLIWVVWMLCLAHSVVSCFCQAIPVTRQTWQDLRQSWMIPNFRVLRVLSAQFAHLLSTIASLFFMLYWRDNENQHDVDASQGLAIFFLSIRFLTYLRGFDRTAFLINMLGRILSDMIPFTCVLTFIVVAFGFVFHLLVGHSDVEYETRENIGHAFHTLGSAGVTSFNMALGDFDIEYFRRAPYPFWATAVFISFMFLVPVVMLNALIAIMSNSYERVHDESDERCTLERAQLLLELELIYPPIDSQMQYIHVLSAATSDIALEDHEQPKQGE